MHGSDEEVAVSHLDAFFSTFRRVKKKLVRILLFIALCFYVSDFGKLL